MSDFGDIAISKTINLMPTDMNQFLKIKFSEKQFSKIFENFRFSDVQHSNEIFYSFKLSYSSRSLHRNLERINLVSDF